MDDEFLRMQKGETSPVTRAWLNQLNQRNAGLQPADSYSVQVESNANRLIDSIALLRDERIEAATPPYPGRSG